MTSAKEPPTNRYEALDSMLLTAIKAGANQFCMMTTREIATVADTLAKPRRDGVREGWRVIDRRLQALRKAGVIKYSRKPGWTVTSSQGEGEKA